MKAENWLKKIKDANLWISGEFAGAVANISSDSRKLIPRSLFFARKGVTRDGHTYLRDLSSDSNILAFVVEKIPDGFTPSVPVILVRDSTAAMAEAAKIFYQDPTGESFCVAVTGTNGKTTTTFLLEALARELKRDPVRSGTIETRFRDKAVQSELTTPDFTELLQMFASLKKEGASAFVFEASSHALEQRRLLGIELDAGIFTNLTPEHLDYHKNMEDYFDSKKKLFGELLANSSKQNKIAVFPLDGTYGSRLFDEFGTRKEFKTVAWAYRERLSKASSLNEVLIIENWKTNLSGSEVSLSGLNLSRETKFKSSLVGQFNIENIMGVLALGLGLGVDAGQLQRVLDSVPPVRGRLEKMTVPGRGAVFIDYAHTPDALENVLRTLRPLTSGKLLVTFGCGGDRDKTKRPKMGAIAELYADEVFVTSDNPRTEDPDQIIADILKGIQRLKPIHVEVDRRKSICEAVQKLGAEDVLLVAGKGHETYQIVGKEKFPFDDREVVRSSI